MFIYQSALIQMRSRIDVLNNELSQVYSYNPIEYVKTRLKTPESIMQKLRKQGHSFNVNDLIEYIILPEFGSPVLSSQRFISCLI